jgi:programmed cell death 6-interacting protein
MLRESIARSIPDKESYEEALLQLDCMHAYYHYLLECEEKGLKSSLSSQQQQHQQQPKFLVLEWESALTSHTQTVCDSLEWDRAGIIWNLVALEAYQATQQPFGTKAGWSKAAQHLQNAASWLQHFPGQAQQRPVLPPNYADFSQTFLLLWQSLLVAQSQRCVYESLACAPRPRHLLLAKLAAAAVPLFATVESIVLKDDESPAPSLTPFSGLVARWADFARAWGMYMSCKAEYHQSQISRERKQWGEELARLDLAFGYASMCKEFMDQGQSAGLQELYSAVDNIMKDLKERIDEQQNQDQPVPTRQELTEIRGEKLVNIDQPLSKLLKAKKTEPIFQNVVQGPDVTHYVQYFQSELEKRVRHITDLCEDRTQVGRKTLASVQLPQSLTAYHQEQTGGGLPEEIWQKVESVQRDRCIALLKQGLWELRDVSDLARSTFRKIESQLDFDLDSDRNFRKENPGFEGHDAEEVQRAFRESLVNYRKLLGTAQTGDETLFKRLDQLDTNPKFKLLQFQKSQLDMLLPGNKKGNGQQERHAIDTSYLSRLFVELSNLFDEREVKLNSLHESVNHFDIDAALASHVDAANKTDQVYQQAILTILKSFEGAISDLHANIDQQDALFRNILSENEQFRIARERSNAMQSGDFCIVMIEDAIRDINDLSKHVNDGKGFYNVIIPKLEKLKQQVGDVSARLTVERLEYHDRADRAQQEENDAMMAQKLSSDNAAEGVAGRRSNGETTEFDEKVATLVAMEFDPAKVVEALQKHNSNVDEALNDLLSM